MRDPIRAVLNAVLVGALVGALVGVPVGARCAAAATRAAPVTAPVAAPPAVLDDRGVRVQLARPAQRIVSLLPSLTETLCALGACERLVGIDRYSNWPASVQALPRLGGLDDTPVERLLALKPDLVLVSKSARATDRLEALGLTVLALDSQSMADLRRSAERIATLVGRPEAAPALLQQIDARIRAAAARIPPGWQGARAYVEVSSAPYAAGEASFIGELLARLGLGNVVPAALGPFPKLNPEFVVRARPDLVISAQRALREMPARPGWDAIPALARGQVCGFEPPTYELLVRAGPRLGEAVDRLADCVAALPQRVAAGPR